MDDEEPWMLKINKKDLNGNLIGNQIQVFSWQCDKCANGTNTVVRKLFKSDLNRNEEDVKIEFENELLGFRLITNANAHHKHFVETVQRIFTKCVAVNRENRFTFEEVYVSFFQLDFLDSTFALIHFKKLRSLMN
jgi:hypothetical protein